MAGSGTGDTGRGRSGAFGTAGRPALDQPPAAAAAVAPNCGGSRGAARAPEPAAGSGAESWGRAGPGGGCSAGWSPRLPADSDVYYPSLLCISLPKTVARTSAKVGRALSSVGCGRPWDVDSWEGWAVSTSRRVVSTVCGKPTVSGKIFGGQNAVGERWPWQASLLYHGKHICGAVLIERHWVASAAHCFLNQSDSPMDYHVLLGYNQLKRPTQHSLQLTVNRVIVHPDFDRFHTMGSDIVMLQLHLPVNFSSHVIPACLPTLQTPIPTHETCWITGWGMVTEDGERDRAGWVIGKR
nr:putative serine protease 47 [Loxodonta africana]